MGKFRPKLCTQLVRVWFANQLTDSKLPKPYLAMNSSTLPHFIEHDESRTRPLVLGLFATCILGCGLIMLNRTTLLSYHDQTQLVPDVLQEIERMDDADDNGDLSEISMPVGKVLKEERTQRFATAPATPTVEKSKGGDTGNTGMESPVRRACGRNCQCCKSEPKNHMGCINDYLGYAAVWYVLSRLVRRKM